MSLLDSAAEALPDTTVTGDAAEQPALEVAAPAAALPIEARYEVGALLGRGGMAEVYKGYDRHLHRPVALKFLRAQDEKRAARLLHEARSQARIDHPHISKVYDAGTLDGRPFLAMQLVAGPSLRAIAASLTLAQKVRVIEQCAQAISVAHRFGVIHRDLKPGNILIEHAEDGTPRPYLVDFGLAESAIVPGPHSGAGMGTAPYMAPEQIRGDAVPDRRTDVYALGATLYELIAGRPPFSAQSRRQIWEQVLSAPPSPLRAIDPRLPEDLVAIVGKCLEKDPARRYQSARALADDLGRFLDGEPIAARKNTLLYRSAMRLRKHRVLALTASTGLLLASCLAAWALHGVWTRRELARLAHRQGAEARQTELRMRLAYLLPAHDLRRDRAELRERLSRLEVEAVGLRGLARGFSHAAIGRGLLALEDWNAARTHLEAAWQAGHHEPDTAAALGYALSMLAERALRDAARIADKTERAARRRDIEQGLHAQALSFLRMAGPASAPPWIGAHIALHEGRLEEAARLAAEAVTKEPSLFEAPLIEAKAYLTQVLQHQEGARYKDAEAALARALVALDASLKTARSHGAAHAELCGAWGVGFNLAMRVNAIEAPRRYERAKEICARAEIVDPENDVTLSSLAALHYRWAEYLVERGKDPRPDVERAIAVALRSLPHAIRKEYGLCTLGNAWGVKARYEASHGLDPEHSFSQSIEYLGRAIAIKPNDVKLHRNLAITWNDRGIHQRAHGLDPRRALSAARVSLNDALKLDAGAYDAHNDLAAAYQTQVEYELDRGLDPREALELGIAHARRAVAGRPSDPYHAATLSDLLTLQARSSLSRGAESYSVITEAQQIADRVIAMDAAWYYGYLALGRALALLSHRPAGKLSSAQIDAVTRAVFNFRLARARNRDEIAIHAALAKVLCDADRAGTNRPAWRAELSRALADGLAINPRDITLRSIASACREYLPVSHAAERLSAERPVPSRAG